MADKNFKRQNFANVQESYDLYSNGESEISKINREIPGR
jgi:hypothetical protein